MTTQDTSAMRSEAQAVLSAARQRREHLMVEIQALRLAERAAYRLLARLDRGTPTA